MSRPTNTVGRLPRVSESASAESPGTPEYQAAFDERLRRQSRDSWARSALCLMMSVGGFLLVMNASGRGFNGLLAVVGALLAVPSAISGPRSATPQANARRSTRQCCSSRPRMALRPFSVAVAGAGCGVAYRAPRSTTGRCGVRHGRAALLAATSRSRPYRAFRLGLEHVGHRCFPV